VVGRPSAHIEASPVTGLLLGFDQAANGRSKGRGGVSRLANSPHVRRQALDADDQVAVVIEDLARVGDREAPIR
jgi:hypothetical protein